MAPILRDRYVTYVTDLQLHVPHDYDDLVTIKYIRYIHLTCKLLPPLSHTLRFSFLLLSVITLCATIMSNKISLHEINVIDIFLEV